MGQMKTLEPLEGMVLLQEFPCYGATKDGFIWSCKRKEWRKMNPYITVYGYAVVTFTLPSGKQHQMFVHRAMMHAFGDGDVPGKEINHINGVKTDNRLSNLEWVTRSENIRHAIDKLGKIRGTNARSNKLSEDDVLSIRDLYASGMKQMDIAPLYGIAGNTVSRICSGKRWSWLKKPDSVEDMNNCSV